MQAGIGNVATSATPTTHARRTRRGLRLTLAVLGAVTMTAALVAAPSGTASANLEIDGSTTTTLVLDQPGVDEADVLLDPVKKPVHELVGVVGQHAPDEVDPVLVEHGLKPEEEEEPDTNPDPKTPPAEEKAEEPTESPDDEPVPEEAPPEEEPAAEEPPPAAYEAKLEVVRMLSVAAAPPTIEVDLVSAVNLSFLDYTDFPLGPRSSRDVVEMLEAGGASPETVVEILTPFPVAGKATYSNDWGAPRHNPSYHPHEGTDLFAARGTPVVASFGGRVSTREGTAIGGHSVTVTGADGTYLYYAHLDGFAPAAVPGAYVDAGTVIGYVGSTGNAAGGLPHLHFEIHPAGGEPIPPLPYLDQWLVQAREEARAFLDGTGFQPSPLRPFVAAAPGPAPAVDLFQPAASTTESPLNAVIALLVIAGPVIAYRRRHTLRALYRSTAALLRLPALDRVTDPVWRALGGRRVGAGGGRPSAPDVLAPFLQSAPGARPEESQDEEGMAA